MARIRTLKPEFWTDEKVGTLTRDERLLFIGLLNLADDEGILKATPAFIKGQVLAYDEVKISDVKKWLDTLEAAKMILSFEYNGEKYFLIRTFKNHQRINRPTPSKVPSYIIESLFTEDSLRTHCIITEDSLPERKGKEQGKEQGKEGSSGSNKFSPPSLEDVHSYFFEKKEDHKWPPEKCALQARKFINHYESKNWFVGKNKMSKWKSAASGWIDRDLEFNNNGKSTTHAQNNASRQLDIINKPYTKL